MRYRPSRLDKILNNKCDNQIQLQKNFSSHVLKKYANYSSINTKKKKNLQVPLPPRGIKNVVTQIQQILCHYLF